MIQEDLEELLLGMGFTDVEDLQRPSIYVKALGGGQWFTFDLTATDKSPTAVLCTVIQKVYAQAHTKGYLDAQKKVRDALGIENSSYH